MRVGPVQENVCVESVGYLLEELRNPETLAAFKADVESANMFIGSLIFVQELAEKVIEVVQPLREKLDAVLIFPSMPDVMRLNKVRPAAPARALNRLRPAAGFAGADCYQWMRALGALQSRSERHMQGFSTVSEC